MKADRSNLSVTNKKTSLAKISEMNRCRLQRPSRSINRRVWFKKVIAGIKGSRKRAQPQRAGNENFTVLINFKPFIGVAVLFSSLAFYLSIFDSFGAKDRGAVSVSAIPLAKGPITTINSVQSRKKISAYLRLRRYFAATCSRANTDDGGTI